MSEANRIGFAGLSHLGIIYSAATAARGFSVIGFDARSNCADELRSGKVPVSEPGLQDLLTANRSRLNFTGEVSDLVACSLIFFALDVATDDHNNSDLRPLSELIRSVAARVRPGTTLVIMSQVPPGFCRRLSAELPEGVRLFYQVETLVFGNAVERAVHPERYMVGCADPEESRPELYEEFLKAFECPILPMRYESAEICKIAINCFLVSSVATANTLAELCGEIHANWSEVVPALRLDKRIGPYAYLKPGLGIAGGNLERDLVTVQNLAAQHGTDARVVGAWQQNSAYARDWALRRLFQLQLLEDSSRPLGIWGLAYKADTHSTKNSPSLALLRSIGKHRCQAYDPVATIDTSAFGSVQTFPSALDVARGASALVVMTAWKEFGAVPLEAVRDAMAGRVILDPYAVLNAGRCRELGFDYHSLGV